MGTSSGLLRRAVLLTRNGSFTRGLPVVLRFIAIGEETEQIPASVTAPPDRVAKGYRAPG